MNACANIIKLAVYILKIIEVRTCKPKFAKKRPCLEWLTMAQLCLPIYSSNTTLLPLDWFDVLYSFTGCSLVPNGAVITKAESASNLLK